MAIRKLLGIALIGCVLGAFVVPATTAAAAKKKAKGPVVVATDPADDWGQAAGAPAPPGTALGMELVEAAIGLSSDKKAIDFILKLNGPTGGGTPESVRYGWDFTVDGNAFMLAGGRTELLRGMCNPLTTDPACPPNVGDPAKLTNFPFFVRSGSCTVGADCKVHGVVNATFDATAATITIPVPLELVSAKIGSKVGPMAGTFGAIYAAPGVLVTQNALPHDSIPMVTKTVVLK